MRTYLRNSADKIGGIQYVGGRNDYYGYGRVNAGAAISAVPPPGGGSGGNSSPVFTNVNEGAVATVAENSTFVANVNATDPDGDTLTYQLLNGDADKFSINSATGAINFTLAPDFENPTDSNLDNVYNFTVRVFDAFGGADSKNVGVSVTDVNEGGAGFSMPANAITNGTSGGWLAGTAADDHIDAKAGDDEIYDIEGNNVIDGGDGNDILRTYSGVLSDYTITRYLDGWITVQGPGVNGPTQSVINVEIFGPNSGNVSLVGPNAVGTQLSTPLFGGNNSNSGGGNSAPSLTNVIHMEAIQLNENTTAVRDFNASDADGDSLIYQINGPDAGHFTIDSSSGFLSFTTAPDYENPQDTGQNNSYTVEVIVVDGNGGTDSATVVVNVNDVDENNGGGGSFTMPSNAITNGNSGGWISGASGVSYIDAKGGDDEIHDPDGNNIIDGGDGYDILRSYEGSSYTTTRYSDGWTVIVGAGNNGSTITQRVRNVEFFTHNGGSVDLQALTIQAGSGSPLTASGGSGAYSFDVFGPVFGFDG